MKSADISRLFHTLRYLRPIQVANRLQRKLFPAKFPRITAPGPPRAAGGNWQTPAARQPSLIDSGTIRVFQQPLPLKSSGDWNNQELAYLVRYNLHYFDDLGANDAAERADWHRDLIDRWIVENPPGSGAGWEPYPLSLRIVNWIKWQLGGQQLEPHQLDSLATQTQALVDQLEYHLLANHLLANAKALVFAGCFFTGDRAKRWLDLGWKLLHRELQEQVLDDGGHFELSPMYHSIILEDVLDVINLGQTYPELTAQALPLEALACRMRQWLAAMCHPDGQISFFNDAAFDIAARPGDIEAYARRLRLSRIDTPSDGITQLPDSGYVRLQCDDATLIADLARVGPNYQPGHAHADTLSFELSIAGQRVFVNSGTSRYGVDDERKRQRSTAAHNTVVVDRKNSSDTWSGFRVGRRATPGAIHVEETKQGLVVKGSHNGYAKEGVTHQRQWLLQGGSLTIDDQLNGRFSEAVGYLHLHPEFKVTDDGDRWTTSELALLLGNSDDVNFRVCEGTFHPRFSQTEANLCIQTVFEQPAQHLLFSW